MVRIGVSKRESGTPQIPMIIRRLRRGVGRPAAIDDTLEDFLEQISDESVQAVRRMFITDDALDTKFGYRNTTASVLSPTYAIIRTPEYIRSLSEGRRPPISITAQQLQPWVIRKIFGVPPPRKLPSSVGDPGRLWATMDQTEIDVVRETAEDIARHIRKSGVRGRRWFENKLPDWLRRNMGRMAPMMQTALNRKFWRR